MEIFTSTETMVAVVHLNFRAGSTFPVPVCTVPSSMDRTSQCNMVDAARLNASFWLNLLLPKGQICINYPDWVDLYSVVKPLRFSI